MRKDVPEYDKLFGMYCWVTTTDGILGVLKTVPEDFIVEEILPDGTILTLERPTLRSSGYEGLFTHFVLVKRNIGNFEALWMLAEKLNVPVGFFFYSGNKDREAVTVQRVAVWGVPPSKLLEIAGSFKEIKIFSPIRELRRVHIGEHLGNRFTITIRDIPSQDILKMEKTYDELVDIMVPNFFGYQRFGIIRPITHVVGKLLFLRKYEEAIRIYLTSPSIVDDNKMLEIKREIENGNYEQALKELPTRGFLFEKVLLKALLKGLNPKEALRRLPAYLLRMLGEAYQAYIFNKILSKSLLEGVFPKDVKQNFLIIIPGYQTKLRDDHISEIIKEVLEEEGISISMFKNNDFLPLSFKGTLRPAFLKPIFHYIFINSEDVRGLRKVILQFSLRKGEYATIVLREFFKQNILRALLSKSISRSEVNIERNYREIIKCVKEGLSLT
ncbi:MAG: tRNA pseudouridine(13) synthase TruD [Candidatus Njordarchaeales archaeon]